MTALDHKHLLQASRALKRWLITCKLNVVTHGAKTGHTLLQYRKPDGTLCAPLRIKDRAHLVIGRCHAKARAHGLAFIYNTDVSQPQVWLTDGVTTLAVY